MPESNVTRYIDYFRKIAQYHPLIAHDPASETADSEPGKKKFARWSADDLATGIRNKVGYPALMIELFETSTAGATVNDIKIRPRGAFTILEHAIAGNINDEERAYSLAYVIAMDILCKIWEQHYGKNADKCTTVFKSFRFESLKIDPIGPVNENEFGYRVEFDFEHWDNISFNRYASGTDPFTNDF